MFPTFFPSEDQQRSPALLATLADLSCMKEFLALIFYPMEMDKLLKTLDTSKRETSYHDLQVQAARPDSLTIDSSREFPFQSSGEGLGGLHGLNPDEMMQFAKLFGSDPQSFGGFPPLQGGGGGLQLLGQSNATPEGV